MPRGLACSGWIDVLGWPAPSSLVLACRYQKAWPVVIPFIGDLFVHFKDQGHPLLASLLKHLTDTREALLPIAPALADLVRGASCAVVLV
jgi:hypothetical protein